METLEQFSARMSEVEKKDEYQVGPWWRGHTRAVFVFENQFCFLESCGYVRMPERVAVRATPAQKLHVVMKETNDSWWTDFSVNGKALAERIAKHYGAEIELNPYQDEKDEWYHFHFFGMKDDEDGWNRLMKLVYDRHTGAFEKMFGCGKVGGRAA